MDTYEKKFNEAFSRAKNLHETCDSTAVIGWCEYIFPELKESEDEKIRKAILELVRQSSEILDKQNQNNMIAWLEKQCKESSWKPSKEEMDVLYGLAYITNQYDERKEEVITRLYQDLKREFFNGSSYENMFPTNTSMEEDVRRRSTIQVLEYARSLDAYNQYGKADIDKNIAWLEKQKEPELSEDLGDYIAELSKQFPEVSFAKLSRIAVRVKNWLEKQGEPIEINPTEFDTRLQALIGKFDSLPKEELIGSLSFWLNVVQNDGTYREEKQGEKKNKINSYKITFEDVLALECSMKTAKITEGGDKLYEILVPLYNKIHNAYLAEKQGEQKPADKVEPKFHEGDWISGYYTNYKVMAINSKGYEVEDTDGNKINILFENEKFHHLFTIKDAKDGDVLVYGDNPDSHHVKVIMLFKAQRSEYSASTYFHIFGNNYRVNDWCDCGKSVHPATKTQRNTLFAKMKEAGYEWDAEKKELKKIELTDVGHEYYSELLKNDKSDNIADYAYQCVYCMSHDWTIENPTWDNVQSACRLGAKWQKKHNVSEEWSEEDEKVSKYALDIPQNWTKEDEERYISCLQRLSTGNPEQPETINSKWFKEHVYHQKQWKPSDEQIRALEYIINNAHNTSYSCKIAKELLEQLRKLKGE